MLGSNSLVVCSFLYGVFRGSRCPLTSRSSNAARTRRSRDISQVRSPKRGQARRNKQITLVACMTVSRLLSMARQLIGDSVMVGFESTKAGLTVWPLGFCHWKSACKSSYSHTPSRLHSLSITRHRHNSLLSVNRTTWRKQLPSVCIS